jgi:hypothetical protein
VRAKLALLWSNVAGRQAVVLWHVMQSVENPVPWTGLAALV